MISDSTEKSCLRLNVSGAEDIVDGRLHLATLCHPACCWPTHGAVGVEIPWISCCGDVGNNRESVGGGRGSGHNILTKIWSDRRCQKLFACASLFFLVFACASPTCLIFFKRDSGTTAAQLLQGSNSLRFANFGNNNMFLKSADT